MVGLGLEAESDVELACSALELCLVLAKVLRIEMLVFGRAGAIFVSQTHHLPVEVYAERIECSETRGPDFLHHCYGPFSCR